MSDSIIDAKDLLSLQESLDKLTSFSSLLSEDWINDLTKGLEDFHKGLCERSEQN